MESQNKVGKIILLSTLSSILYALESLFPKPFPFIRIGFGNILVLFTIIEFGFIKGIFVGISKSIIGGLLSGTFFTPSTLLSFSGTIISIIIMFLLYKIEQFGIIGISVAGSILNILIQIFLVSIFLTGFSSFFYLFKYISLFSLFTGIITGFITFYLLIIFERRKNAIKSYS